MEDPAVFPSSEGDRSAQVEAFEREPSTWTIAQLADEFGVTHRTLRHWEDIGLIQPQRRGTARVYGRRDRTRVNLIARGKRLGFPLDQIRTIIDLYDAPRGRRSQLEFVLEQIDDRRSDLLARRADLDAALAELDTFEARCRREVESLSGAADVESMFGTTTPG